VSAEDVEVLIPAATAHAELATIKSVGLTPLAGSPVVVRTVGYLAARGFRRFTVAVPPGDDISKILIPASVQDVDVEVIEASTPSLLHTVKLLMAGVEDGPVLVVLGDTYFEFESLGFIADVRTTVFSADVNDPSRWCCLEVTEGDSVTWIRNKEASHRGKATAAIGAYFFPDGRGFRDAVTDYCRDLEPDVLDLSPVLWNRVLANDLRIERATGWLDAGHLDRAANASRSLLESRAFNSVSVNDLSGTITKRSVHVEKIREEVAYLEALPADLAVFFPRLLAKDISEGSASYTLEYYGYSTLRELYLWHQLDVSRWQAIFIHIREIMFRAFERHQASILPEAVDEMYMGKLQRRVHELMADPQHRNLTGQEISVNGVVLENVALLEPWLRQVVDEFGRSAVGQVIHGDLCFSNILYDIGSSTCRFIDPRGAFGETGIYGDVRYDVSKLWHSLEGGYEQITAGAYSLQWNDLHSAEFELPLTSLQAEIRDAFAETFFAVVKEREIRVITGLIMCSIAALHSEDPRRQQALYLRGLQMLNDAKAEAEDGASIRN
jgi:dTDP-glucose pyrophosphorylase